MKHSIVKRIMLLLLVVILLLPVFCACAEEGEHEEEQPLVEWTVSEDGKTISNGTKTYKRINASLFETVPVYGYRYYNTVSIPDNEEFTNVKIKVPYPDAEYMWMFEHTGNYVYVYATEEGIDHLNRFLNGEYGIYRLWAPNEESAVIDEEFSLRVQEMAKSAKTVKKSVLELKECTRYEIVAYNEYESFLLRLGCLYLVDGTWYYLDYSKLDNTHFDSDGYFSYRRGSVMIAELSAEVGSEIDVLSQNVEYLYRSYVDEYDPWADVEEEPEIPMAFFWIVYVFAGFFLPAPFLVIGLLLPRLRGFGKPKYWYVTAVFAALWMVLALVLLLMLI